ncbi:MAG TPA: phosphoglycolate phosphatase, partial [Candidatus Marinimicrobia bacterium]|nr:phosphoglycolate phosphatase [Candidatus Neomarinimicrobiota bacterium]
IKAVIFDLDGTLVDTAADILAAVNFTMKIYGLKPITYEQCLKYLGDGVEDLVKRAVTNSLSEPIDPDYLAEIVAQYKKFYSSHLTDRSHLFPGVSETLAELQDYTLVVISNKSHNFCLQILKQLDIEQYFQLIIGGDLLPARKPDPGQLLYVMQKFNLTASQILIVGDSENDILAAHSIGAPVVVVKYGYRAPESLQKYHPDYVIDNFSELLLILR